METIYKNTEYIGELILKGLLLKLFLLSVFTLAMIVLTAKRASAENSSFAPRVYNESPLALLTAEETGYSARNGENYPRAIMRLVKSFRGISSNRIATSGMEILHLMEPDDSRRYARHIAHNEAIGNLEKILSSSEVRSFYQSVRDVFSKAQNIAEVNPVSAKSPDTGPASSMPPLIMGLDFDSRPGAHIKIGGNSKVVYTPSQDKVMFHYGLNF